MRKYKDVFLTKEGLACNEDGKPFNNKSNIRRKLVEGVGVNDFPFSVARCVNKKTTLWKPYQMWVAMLHRAYNKKYKDLQKTYADVVVCSEWLTFSCFLHWLFEQPFNNSSWELDKDLLGNGKLYSESSCILVPKEVNKILAISKQRAGTCYFGTSKSGKYYKALLPKRFGSNNRSSSFNTPEEAQNCWYEHKVEQTKHLKPILDLIDNRLFPIILFKLKNILKQ